MDQQNLSKLIDLLRKKGVSSYKTPEVSLELLPEAPQSNYKKKQDLSGDPIQSENPFNEDDALFWSSAGIPEVKEEVQ